MSNIKLHRSTLIVFSIILSITGTLGMFVNQVSATPVQAWNPGYIIDDQVFTNANTMDVASIQSFLASKVPVCDTGGTLPATDFGRPDLTHKQYAEQQIAAAQAAGKSTNWTEPPYTCLKDFSENGITSAQIIYNAAQTYKINPQVLLVLIQKESSLLTDTWPLAYEYQAATGYGCPDSTPGVCTSQYYGFTNQVNWAAKMYHAIMTSSPTWYSPYVLGNNTIYYNPGPFNTAAGSYYGRFGTKADIQYCGATTVNIQNLATAALYDYTPYQPNQAALNAGYGTGDLCSAYGNRNFFEYFTDWFGSPNLQCGPNETPMPQVVSMYNPKTYDHFMTSYRCEAQYLGYKAGYTYEGAVFNTTDPTAANAVPVYRLYNPITYQHLWTTSQADINSAVASSGYRLEGIAFYSQ